LGGEKMGIFDDDEKEEKPERREKTYTLKELRELAKVFGVSTRKKKKE